jgi:hypothetical protein
MLSGVKMFGGVLVLRRIAAAHVSAGHTQTQVNPPIARLEAFFAATSVGFHLLD